MARGHQVDGPEFNLLNYDEIESILKQKSYNVIIHLAAISHVPTCEKDPGLAYQTNLGGTALLLEAIRRHQPETHLIFTSTAQDYAPAEGTEITEGVTFSESRR